MPAGSYRFQVGSIVCTVLSDGYFSFPASWLFPSANSAEVRRGLEGGNPGAERVLCPYTCMLIQTGRHVILVDTGAGETSATSGAIRARLEIEGVRPGDIDTVVLTHAHPDHIGGTVDARGRPAFPNARHIIAESEWEFWNGRVNLSRLRAPNEWTARMKASVQACLRALRFQVETIEGEMEVAPGVRMLPAPGHTPGHMSLSLESGDERLLHLGDAAVHGLHLENPVWDNGFDWDPAVAAQTRSKLLDRAISGNMHLMASHFPFPSVGRAAERAEGGWKWAPGW